MNLTNEQLREFSSKIKRDDFATQLNSKFIVNGVTEVELIDVSPIKSYTRQESFSMLFAMPGDFSLEQRLYLFEHPELGTHEIFVVPIEKKSDKLIFEAVFNYLLAD